MSDGQAFDSEATEIGEQSLISGVTPITAADRLAFCAAAPMEPKRPQRPCDLGLFDLNARNQLDHFARHPFTPTGDNP